MGVTHKSVEDYLKRCPNPPKTDTNDKQNEHIDHFPRLNQHECISNIRVEGEDIS